jgi:adenylate kinase family enzyme
VLRIVILGCAGSGKTTLARRLGEYTGAPVISLDALWQPHWDAKDVPAFRSLMKQAHAGDRWISEGNFAQTTFDIRLPRATLVIWLERSRLLCMWRAMTRVARHGESHRINKLGEVLTFIWNFNRVNRPRIEAHRELHGPSVPIYRLTGKRDIVAFLSLCNKAADWRISN